MGSATLDEMRATARLALPLVVAQVAVMAMGLVDTAVVGHFSVPELGAVSLGVAVTFGFITFGAGFSLALEPLVAQAVGAGDLRGASAWWSLGVRVCVLVGIPLAALSVVAGYHLDGFGIAPELAARTGDYLLARAPANVLFLVYLAGRSFLQSHNVVRPLIVAAVVANVVNLLANLLLVFGDEALGWIGLPPVGLPPLGAVGAGLATTLSSAVMVALILSALGAVRAAAGPAERRPAARALVLLALPIGLQGLAEAGVFSLLGVLAGRFGPHVAGAHQIALNLSALTFMAAVGIGSAASARVGQAVGRGDGPGARRAGFAAAALGLAFMGATAVVFYAVPEPLARAFSPEAAVVPTAVSLLGVAAFFQLFDGNQAIMSGALRGAGDVRLPSVAHVVAHWLIGFPVAWTLGFEYGWGALGLWYGLTAGLVAVATFLTLRFAWLSSRELRRLSA